MQAVTLVIAMIITSLIGYIAILQNNLNEKEALLAVRQIKIETLKQSLANAKHSIDAQNKALERLRNERDLAQSKMSENERIEQLQRVELKGGNCESELDTLYTLLAVAAVR